MSELSYRHIEFRVAETYSKLLGEHCPIFSINLDHNLEVHSGGYDEKIASLGFKYLREGYFCSVWEIPEELLGSNWRAYKG
jgi:hypothetical protein